MAKNWPPFREAGDAGGVSIALDTVGCPSYHYVWKLVALLRVDLRNISLSFALKRRTNADDFVVVPTKTQVKRYWGSNQLKADAENGGSDKIT